MVPHPAMRDWRVIFGRNVRRVRQQQGLTQEQLSELADVSTRHISFVETGKRQPTLSVLVALCDGLGVTLTAFSVELEKQLMTARERSDNKRPD